MLARAAGAALDLVRDQHDPVAVAQLAQPHHEFLRRDVEAAFALHRLEDDGRDAIRGDVALEDHLERAKESSTVTPCSAFGNGAW